MEIKTNSLKLLVLGTLAGIGVHSLLVPQPSLAQSNQQANPLQDLQTQDSGSDPFSSRNSDGGTSSLLNLMQRVQQGNSRSLQDFSTEQNGNLDAAAARFREMQRKRIQGGDQANQINRVATPQPRN